MAHLSNPEDEVMDRAINRELLGEGTGWEPRYGITRWHWSRISEYAASEGLYLLIRSGKESALRWIEADFPGKPMELGFLKVDAQLGLLVATDPDRVQRVYAAGHYVLAPQSPPMGGFVASNPARGPLGRVFRQGWARAGVVIDRQTQLPFTSDYDLAAIIGASGHFNAFGTMGSMAPGLPGTTMAGKHHFTNLYTEAHRHRLNALLGSKRFLHGTQVQYFDDSTSNTFANSGHETILAFHPDRNVYRMLAPAGVTGAAFVWNVLRALLPEHEATFNN